MQFITNPSGGPYKKGAFSQRVVQKREEDSETRKFCGKAGTCVAEASPSERVCLTGNKTE